MKMLTTACLTVPTLVLSIGMALAATDADNSSATQAQGAQTTATRQPSAAALARAQNKLAHAQQIASQLTTRANAEGLPQSWHTEMLSMLMQIPESAFDAVQVAPSAHEALETVHRAVTAAKLSPTGTTAAQPKSLGDDSDDLTYIPLASPCRIVDTRQSGAGGALAAGATRIFIFGESATQGSSSCSPFVGYVGDGGPGAAAVNITVDAVGSTAGPGAFLQAYPDGGSTTTSWLNFAGGEIVANAGILPIATNGDFDIHVNGMTNVIIDVFGSFTAPAPTALNCVTSNSFSITTSNAGQTITTSACAAGYALTGGSCAGTSSANQIQLTISEAFQGSQWRCAWINYSNPAVSATYTASNQCCQVPGRTPDI